MFEQFFLSIQQDFKLFIFFPILCAVFRAIFIAYYGNIDQLGKKTRALGACFRFGFWWGMDFNAYVFLLSAAAITLPGLFLPVLYINSDMIRIAAALAYALVLYAAFSAKMIFYSHFHDNFNGIVLLGRRAEKHNLMDVFFHQHHGLWLLFGIIPYLLVCAIVLHNLLVLPTVPYPRFSTIYFQYIFQGAFIAALPVVFYYFRYGGTLIHDNKPEWDTVPDIVKDDVFLAKATVDDLIALEYVWKNPADAVLQHDDQEDRASFRQALEVLQCSSYLHEQPLYSTIRTAHGAKLAKPSHIFLIVGESYGQNYIEPFMDDLHISDGLKGVMKMAGSVSIPTCLGAGVISRPSIASLMSGIFDANLEINEREAFWQGTVPTSLPVQLKRLGYSSTYWYGGSVAHGNFNHFAPSCGFDRVMSAPDFCDSQAPRSWVGVYDGEFLQKAGDLIEEEHEELQFHFLYTTSNHGPYKIDLKKYGYEAESIMPQAPQDVKENRKLQQMLGTFWYADRAIAQFIKRMKAQFPDSLFIFTGDHGAYCSELQHTTYMNRPYTLREMRCPVLFFQHPRLTSHILAHNSIGGHMNIMPTIMELIAPAGFSYYSLTPSLTESLEQVITPFHWLNKKELGEYATQRYQQLFAPGDVAGCNGQLPYETIHHAEKNLTGYLLRHPELLVRPKHLCH